MPHPLTFAALSALALVGSGVGVYLGRSAVSEINPAYYASPPPGRWHADLSPGHSVPGGAQLVRAGSLSPAELDQALGRGCVGCQTDPQQYRPVHARDEDSYRGGWAFGEETPVVQVAEQIEPARPSEADLAEQAVAEAERQAALVAVHRYSTFEVVAPAPVEALQATQLASVDVPAQE